eukprot:117384-Chlamydomonas_euryale.AAC.2
MASTCRTAQISPADASAQCGHKAARDQCTVWTQGCSQPVHSVDTRPLETSVKCGHKAARKQCT